MKVIVAPHVHFDGFVQARTDSLLSTAFLLTRNASEAEELVQDTLVALYPQWSKVLAADSELAYVRRALVNRFLNRRRSKAGREVVTDVVPERPDQRDFSTVLDDRDQLRRALAGLPARQRAAIVLRYFHDYTDQQAADAMGCRIGTVRSLISRALASLRADPTFTESDTRPGVAR